MNAITPPAPSRRASTAVPAIGRRGIGIAGVMLSLAVLASSALLRLATTLHGGAVTTSLPAAVEDPVRLAHRVAAMGISVLALGVFVIAFRGRKAAPPADPSLRNATVILLLTVFLSALGPLTPGYRFDAVTVGNVAGGVALVLAFQAWWLGAAAGRGPASAAPRIAMAACAAFTAQVMLGAWSSAQAMGGRYDVLLPHLACALLLVAAVVLWWLRQVEARRPLTAALALLAMQCGGGAALALVAERPLSLAVAHAMLSPLIGMALLAAWRAGRGCRDDA